MQSNGDSFCGDVVLDSFNISYRDKDSISDQKYEKQISWALYYEDFSFEKELIKYSATIVLVSIFV